MKVLMVIPSLSKKWGGTTTSVVNFYHGLSRHESVTCKVISAVAEDEKDEISNEVVDNDDFILFLTKYSSWRYSKGFKNYLKKNIRHYDVIWIHSLWTSATFFAARYAKKHDIPYIVSPHGMIEPDAMNRKRLKKRIYWSLVEKKVFNDASAIHCITEAESLHSRRLSKTITIVIPNGVAYEPYMEKDFKRLRVICFIGRFHEIKGLDLLLKAIAKIDSVKLIVAGGGRKEYEHYIYSLVKKLNIENRVEFKGFVDNKVKGEIFKQSSFLILPSHSEGLSIVGIESIMNSTPVLTTQKCNFDNVQKYNAGIVMESNEPDVIKKYIMIMLGSDIEEMSKNAHKLAMEKYRDVSVSDVFMKKIEDIVSINDEE